MPIPVYVFTGFLDAGKTKFIQETLEDPRFNAGERTLLLAFEEGEEEYDLSAFPKKNVFLEVLDQDQVTTQQLAALQAELNGMKLVGDLYARFPKDWAVAQEVMFADASTILQYNANMRNLVVDKLSGCEMVVFNRVLPDGDTMPLHKLARAVNRRVDILYESTDGASAFDEIEDPLPFDLNAPVIAVGDEDYGLWYRDISEEPEKYQGKTVRFKAQVARLRRDKDGIFAPGRFVMTCCVEDIQFCGIPCKFSDAAKLKAKSWVTVTAKISAERHALYQGELGPILTALTVEPCSPAAQEVVTF